MTLRFIDMLKLTFKIMGFKFEQKKLATTTSAIVKTCKGSVRGVKRYTIWGDSYYSFEKIPYAKPPLGELRFKAPEPNDEWNGILDCTHPAEKPLQSNVIFRKWRGSEDCLYLNVFTKNIDPDKLKPVMVWIYGGGFQMGEATRDIYSPDFFMSKDIVLVTIAYRLGPFGFLSLEDPQANVPGNAGIKDQVLSLKWVHDNISSFGGDPNNITLFGESAGGASTHLCMLTEKTEGLFHKAIVQSGSALCPWAKPPKNDWAFRFAKSLGFTGEKNDMEVLKFLRTADGSKMVIAASTILAKEEKHNRVLFAFGPVIEPYITQHCVIPEDPFIMMQKTWSNSIPLMIGGTSFEGLLFHPEVARRPATLSEVKDCLNLLPVDLDPCTDSDTKREYGLRIKKAYFGDKEPGLETKFQFLDIESYREFWHPIYRTARQRLVQNAASTYLYRFDYDSELGNGIRNLLCGKGSKGACHGDDMCYLFYSMFSHRFPREAPEDRIIRLMIDLWTSFAENSDPNCDMLEGIKFHPIDNMDYMKCLNINEKSEFIDLPETEKLKIWSSFYHASKL